MADTFTPFLNLTKPQIGGDPDTWGSLLNGDMDLIDAGVKAANDAATAAASNSVPRAGGTMTGALNFTPVTPFTGITGLVHSTADIGGSYASWTTRPYVNQIDAQTDTNAYGLIRWTHQGVRNLGAIDLYSGGTGSSVPQIAFHIGTTTSAFTFDGSGNLTAVGNIGAFSDKRLKTNFATIANALAKTKALNGVTYDRVDLENAPRHVGLIAQDVHAVLPEAVSEDERGYLRVSYGNLAGLFVESIKELEQMVDKLEKRVAVLEGGQ